MIRARRVGGRSAGGLQAPHRSPMALCGSCNARDGERIPAGDSREPGWRDSAGTFGCPVGGSVADGSSSWEWNRSQPCQGATELGFPRPALWQMQGESACRAGEPSG